MAIVTRWRRARNRSISVGYRRVSKGAALVLKARNVYSHQALDRILNPASVAVVGASPNPKSAGARAVGQLELLGFDGRIDLVNAKYDLLDGGQCYPSVSALPAPPDMVIVTVPQAAVENVVLDAAAAGAGGAIIFAAGYADTGREDRRHQQERLGDIARESGMRIIGPNCLGAVNFAAGAGLTYTNTPVLLDADGAILRPARHAIGLVSQSGGLGFAAAQSVLRGVSLSHILTSGNSCDVDVADYIAYLAHEPSCTAIACVFEAMPHPDRLFEAAEQALAAGKPIVIHKLGTGEEGAAAAMTHSGMLAGSHDGYLAAFDRAGMTVVDSFESLIETASYFAKADAKATPGIVVLASSGGASVMAADKAEIYEVPLPQPDAAIRDALQTQLPDFGTARNPCDVTGGVANDLEAFFGCVDLLLGDPQYGSMVTAHPYSVHTANRVRSFGEMAEKHGKLIHNVWITEYLAGPGLVEAERDPKLTVFRSMDKCFAAIGAWNSWNQRRADRLAEPPARRLSNPAASQAAGKLICGAPAAVLTEREAKAVLAEYGVDTVQERLVQSVEEAVAAASAVGFPVVLKIESPDILHKTEAGVIALDLRDADAVGEAAARILAAARAAPGARVNGILVQPMLPAGVEVIVGTRIDPQFGPLLILGLGGVFVELLRDTVVAPVPIGPAQAERMIAKLRGAAVLDGFRGGPAVDRKALAEIVCRISELLADQADRMAGLDVNPLICAGDRIVAVDALLLRRETKR